MKNIAIIGAGLMVKPIVDYFLNKTGYKVTLMDRILEKAVKIKDGRDRCNALVWNNNNEEELDNVIKNSENNHFRITKHFRYPSGCLKIVLK